MSRHLKFAFGFAFLVMGFSYACQPNPVVPELPPDHVVLRAGVMVPTQAGPTVIADTVNVSLCPPNADCFVQDNASVSLRLSKGSASKSLRLFAFIPNYTRKSSVATDSLAVNLGGEVYKVILRDGQAVDKSPGTPVRQVVVQVSRL